jgi:hypothetical protein
MCSSTSTIFIAGKSAIIYSKIRFGGRHFAIARAVNRDYTGIKYPFKRYKILIIRFLAFRRTGKYRKTGL